MSGSKKSKAKTSLCQFFNVLQTELFSRDEFHVKMLLKIAPPPSCLCIFYEQLAAQSVCQTANSNS